MFNAGTGHADRLSSESVPASGPDRGRVSSVGSECPMASRLPAHPSISVLRSRQWRCSCFFLPFRPPCSRLAVWTYGLSWLFSWGPRPAVNGHGVRWETNHLRPRDGVPSRTGRQDGIWRGGAAVSVQDSRYRYSLSPQVRRRWCPTRSRPGASQCSLRRVLETPLKPLGHIKAILIPSNSLPASLDA